VDPDPLSSHILLAAVPAFWADYGIYFFLVVLLLLCSAIASSTEVAYFSLTQSEVKTFREQNGLIWELIKKPKALLATILIFNNLVNVAIVLISSLTLKEIYDAYEFDLTTWGPWLFPVIEVGLVTFILLFFGEITPKIYASQNRLVITRLMSVPIYTMRIVLSPMSFILLRSTNFLDRRVNVESSAASFADIKHAIDLTSEEESPEEEKGILKGIVNLSNTTVRSIMRARVDIAAADIEMSLQDVVDTINSEGYSRMPVVDDSLDRIKGILYAKDLLPLLRDDNDRKDWQTLIRPAYFIPETKKISDLLDEFKSRRLHIAIVVDEFGGTAGLVTLEDIIEEIFGEIVDEFDEEELVSSKLSDNVYVFDGKLPLNDLVRTMDLGDEVFEEVKGNADSLAGLILELHGKIPERGEVIQYEQFRFVIESVAKNRIKRVKMEILSQVVGETQED
jgi:putative hemolysin